MAGEMKAAKDIGWDYISLSKKGFDGAVQGFRAADGSTVAVAFNMHEAFVVRDDQGLFGVEDIKEGIIKARDIDIERTGTIEGVELIAWETEDGSGEVEFNEEALEALGLNDFSVRESIKNRILLLAALDKMVDAI